MKAKLFEEIRKDATVSSVHVETASDSGKPPKKKPNPQDKFSADWETEFNIEKIDADQRLIFGWASVVQKGDQIIIDKHGDIIPIEELEKAAYNFVLISRENDDMHTAEPTGVCVESMVFTPEKAALGLVAKNAQGEQIFGWFTGFKITKDSLWADHKAGKRPEFSIGGVSQRVPA